MTLRLAATILFFLGLGLEGALLCPPDSCLVRKAKGDTYLSFGCERWPNEGYTCAHESMTCACDGFVKYGDWDRKDGTGNIWTGETDVKGSITCNNENFGHVVKKTKNCVCRPRTLAVDANNKSTITRASFAACEGNIEGYAAPTCVMVKASPDMGMSASAMYGMGFGQGGMALVMSMMTFNPMMKVQHTTIVEMSTDTLVGNYRIPCSGKDGMPTAAECMAKIDEAYADPSIASAVTRATINLAGKDVIGGDVWNMKDFVNIKFDPSSMDNFPDAPTALASGMTCPGMANGDGDGNAGSSGDGNGDQTGAGGGTDGFTTTGSFEVKMTSAHATLLTANAATAKGVMKAALAATTGKPQSGFTITSISVDGTPISRRLQDLVFSRRLTDSAVKVMWEGSSATKVMAEDIVLETLANNIDTEAKKMVDSTIVIIGVPADTFKVNTATPVKLSAVNSAPTSIEKTSSGAKGSFSKVIVSSMIAAGMVVLS